MRKLRELPDESAAVTLSDALWASGIEARILDSQQGGYAVWVIEEDKLKEAETLSAHWLDRGGSTELASASQRGRAARELNARIEERKEQKRKLIQERMAQLTRPRPVLLTWGLIAMCVLVAALTTSSFDLYRLATDRATVSTLLIIDPRRPITEIAFSLLGVPVRLLSLHWDQPWRLVTPIFLHFNVLHILLNMLWLRDLGATIERRHGALYLGVFTLVSAVLPNIAQYEIAQNPLFGGMSGVVYGLLGLVWARGRFDPHAGYALSPSTLQFMLIWLGLGFIGEISVGLGMTQTTGIANWCHLFGLLVGVAWGYLASRSSR